MGAVLTQRGRGIVPTSSRALNDPVRQAPRAALSWNGSSNVALSCCAAVRHQQELSVPHNKIHRVSIRIPLPGRDMTAPPRWADEFLYLIADQRERETSGRDSRVGDSRFRMRTSHFHRLVL